MAKTMILLRNFWVEMYLELVVSHILLIINVLPIKIETIVVRVINHGIFFWWDWFSKQIYSFFFFCLFRATPMAYGGSQARGWIGAIAAGLCQTYSKYILNHGGYIVDLSVGHCKLDLDLFEHFKNDYITQPKSI